MDGPDVWTLHETLLDHSRPSEPCFTQPNCRTRSPGGVGPPIRLGLATAVEFTLGSDWAPVLALQDVFTASTLETRIGYRFTELTPII